MNEKLQYATMLEIPVNTANITYKPTKKRRIFKRKGKSPEAVKEELLSKVNAESEIQEQTMPQEIVAETSEERVEVSEEVMPQAAESAAEEPAEQPADEVYVSTSVRKKKRKPFFKFSVISAEIVAIAVLVGAIFLTNALYSDSAINVFMRRVFSVESAAAEKTYKDFSPVMNFNGDVSVDNGIISYTGSGAVYAPTFGTVSSVVQEEDGTYTMNIAHSAVFSSTLSGLSYAYLGAGDSVFGNIPVGYVKDGGLTMCFNSENAVITDYTIEDNAVLWAV